MNALRFSLIREILAPIVALAACTLLTAAASADDLLYASDGKQLFTVDLQTGALTFISDGPRQWIASPAFDEEHHTRLWVSGFPRDLGFPFGTQSVTGDGAQFTWGNPITGDRGGPYPATLSYWGSSFGEGGFITFGSDVVYAPTTKRLYTIGYDFGYYWARSGQPSYTPIMIDQYGGVAGPDWGHEYLGFWDVERYSSLAFDSTSGLILVAYTGGSDDGGHGYGVWTVDPVTGQWGTYFSSVSSWEFRFPRTSILAMAVEPATGDLYFLRVQSWDPPTSLTFVRRDPTTGQEIAIAELPFGSWSLNFADAKYAQ